MHCPRCESTTLDERERDGIVVDVCRSCRGMWLDRGELEKLIARATRDEDDRRRDSDRPPSGRYEDRKHDSDRPPSDRYDDRYRDHRHDKRYRKRSWLESIGDIFD